MAGEFLQSFFHQIPNGITLIFALSSLAAGALAMAKRHHHNRFYTFFWWTIIFMVMWRSFKGIISIRYAALLIYPAAAVIAFGCCRIGTWLRFFRGYYPRLPRRFCDVVPALLVAAAAGGCLAISWYKLTASTPVYRTIYATIRAKQQKGEKVHPNPKFALEDNLNAQPDFLDGYEIDEAWEQNVPLVQVHFNGLYKICRLADAQAFGLTIARPFDQMAG